MLILPAIDLKDGHVVRLRQGKADEQTTYRGNPVDAALRWRDAGAEWLHLVDLDGAFEGRPANLEAIRAIVAAVDIPCELGGGIRALGSAAKLLSLGVARIIFGTVAITNPDIVRKSLERFGPDRVVIGLDARDGRVALRGWTQTSELTALDVANRMKAEGITRVIYTDIERDGTFTGPNVEATVELARGSGLHVIASGGVSSVGDVERLAVHEPDGIEGAVIGKALYDGALNLGDAIRAAHSGSGPAGAIRNIRREKRM